MKILIEDYQRRLKTAKKMLEDMANSHVVSVEKRIRIETKASEYRTFIAEMERELRNGVSLFDLWVVQQWVGEKPEQVYFSEDDAKTQALLMEDNLVNRIRKSHSDMSEKEFKGYFKQSYGSFHFKVMNLDDALYEYGQEIHNEYLSQDNPGY